MKLSGYLINYRAAFLVAAFFLLVFLPFLSFDFGITCDEYLHQTHGKFLLRYLKNESAIAIQNPFTEDGKFPDLTSETPVDSPNWSRMNIYGGIFDLLSNVLYEFFPSAGEYEIRHLLGSILGLLAMVFSGLIAKELGGWRAACLTLVFLAVSPRFLAHSMNNPKDLAFAAMYVFTLYQMILFFKEYPKVKIQRIIWLALGISLAICVRVSGLLLICYFLLFSAINFSSIFFQKIVSKEELATMFKHFSWTLLIAIAGYAGIWLFWPYARNASFFYPVFVLKEMSNFDVFDSYNLFAGKWIHRWEIPWNYIPQWIWVTAPLFIPAGFAMIPFVAIGCFQKIHRINRKYLLMLAFAVVFPILFVIINKSNVLDEYRHLLFVYPLLAIIASLSWEAVARILPSRKLKIALLSLAGLFISEPLWWMTKNHPHQCAYFTPLIGGTDGAFRKYETDYWGNSLRTAAEWIGENKKPVNDKDTVKVTEWYIRGISASYYLQKYNHVKADYSPLSSDQWDYWIYLASAAKHSQQWLADWPPPGTVHEIKAENTPLCAIIVNRLKRPDEYALSCEEKAQKNPTAENCFQAGVAYYQAKKHEKSIEWYQRAVEADPEYEAGYNNLGISLMELNRTEEAIKAYLKALEINPGYELSRNNLNHAIQIKFPGKKMVIGETEKKKTQAKEFINQSIVFYNKKEYQKCIDVCLKALELDPANAIAYNNIGISYYMLGNYPEAEKACKKALKIQPGFTLAENNLKMVREKTAINNQ